MTSRNKQPMRAALRERTKELNCLYSVARLAESPDRPVPELLRGLVALLPPAWQYPELARARIVLDGDEFVTPDFAAGAHGLSADIVVSGVRRGSLELHYPEFPPGPDPAPFLDEERHLLEALARELAVTLERRQAREEKELLEEKLRHVDRLADIGRLAVGVAQELVRAAGGSKVSLPGKERILVVDDSPATVEVLERNLENRGHQVVAVSSADEAKLALASTPVDLVITALKTSGGDGLDLVRHVRDRYPAVELLMITGYPASENAVQAFRGGALEYLAKPFTPGELDAAMERVLARIRSTRSAKGLSNGSPWLAGRSPTMVRVRDQSFRAANSNNPVLVLGEQGTGRETVARAIHYTGSRAEWAFVPVACGRIPSNRFERELLGASGLLAAARRGTVFLAEVHLLDPASQQLLSGALSQAHECRVMASGPTDLAARSLAGRFRPELLARLEATRIDLPALRDRREDIAPLAESFLARAAAPGSAAPTIDEEAMELLEQHDWPGNALELEAVMRAFKGSRLTASELPRYLLPGASVAPTGLRTLAEWELEHNPQALASVGGNKTRAAAILGIDRKTLRQKLR